MKDAEKMTQEKAILRLGKENRKMFGKSIRNSTKNERGRVF